MEGGENIKNKPCIARGFGAYPKRLSPLNITTRNK